MSIKNACARWLCLIGILVTVTAWAQTRTLTVGWSLLGTPPSSDLNMVSVFGNADAPTSISTKVNSVWSWSSTQNKWNFYAPSMTVQQLSDYSALKGYNILNTLSAGDGFWINAKEAFDLDLTGGGGSSNVAKNFAISAGDSITYLYTSTSQGIGQVVGPQGYRTRYFTAVTPEGSYQDQTSYQQAGSMVNQRNINNDRQVLSTYTNSNQSTCTYTQPNTFGKNLSVGLTFDISSSYSCTNSTGYSVRTKGSVVSSELKSIPVGKFDSYKVVYTTTYSSISSDFSWVNSYTCWYGKFINEQIACDWEYVNNTGSSYVASFSIVGLSIANYSDSKPTVARFAGSWSLEWSGSNSGACDITVGSSGSIIGTCPGGVAVSGSIDVNGAVTVSTLSGATIGIGNATSTISANGTWTNASEFGTWKATHL